MSAIIEPFKCQDVLVSLGSSCEQQKQIYNNLYNLRTGVTTLAPNSVAVGSGLGDTAWNDALTYEDKQKEITKQKEKELIENSTKNIENFKNQNKKIDNLIYVGIGIIILGVVFYEFKTKK
jgi:hypothetical protein